MSVNTIHLVKVSDTATVPTRATTYSACFDLYADLVGRKIKLIDPHNNSWTIDTLFEDVIIPPNCRAMIPTGFKMQCPVDMAIKFYPRSGNAVKSGIRLANGTGVIDADFPDETMVVLHNASEVGFKVNHADRISQMELTKVEPTVLNLVDELPTLDSNRTGGFGHSGQ